MNPAEIDALAASVQATKSTGTKSSSSATTARAPQLTDFEAASLGTTEVPISLLLDLTLPVSIELGRTNMTVQEILRLGRGAVIQ
ncbi:MAG: FliM/FliN family flagellar motor switch protein, partial [Gemmatimonadota bacterium]|nr:FliM/FliN family flagellar motor switch protein [Gemmatimonadota bacterium]